MIMYLVDDEKNIRDSIKTYVPWGDLGVSKVIASKSGVDALEKMELNPPDVVLSDIRMPKMNGIEFAEKVKELYPDCVIIFLSGFADKEYLKSAIQLEAFQFVEKPIDIQSLMNIVKEAISKKKVLLKKTDHVNTLEKSYLDNLPLIREHILNILVSSPYSMINPQIQNSLHSYPVLCCTSVLFACIHFNLPKDITDINIYELKNRVLYATLSEDWLLHTLTGFHPDNEFLILADGSMHSSLLFSYISPLLELLDFPCTYSIGYSTIKAIPSGIKDAYAQAHLAASYQFYYGSNQNIFYSHTLGTSYPIPFRQLQQFKESLQAKDKELSFEIIGSIFKDLMKQKPVPLISRQVYIQLFSVLFQEENIKSRDNNFMKNQEICKSIDQANLLTDIHQLLTDHLNNFYYRLWQAGDYDNRILEIIQFVQKNMSDSQLSVSSIAEVFQLSQAYLCSYFKKETSTTLHQYITNARIEQAKYLLSHTNSKIYDIAVKVGFSDTNYFSALFKQQVGTTPLVYRKGKTEC